MADDPDDDHYTPPANADRFETGKTGTDTRQEESPKSNSSTSGGRSARSIEFERALKQQRGKLRRIDSNCHIFKQEMTHSSRQIAKTICDPVVLDKIDKEQSKLLKTMQTFRLQLVDSIKHAIDGDGCNRDCN